MIIGSSSNFQQSLRGHLLYTAGISPSPYEYIVLSGATVNTHSCPSSDGGDTFFMIISYKKNHCALRKEMLSFSKL